MCEDDAEVCLGDREVLKVKHRKVAHVLRYDRAPFVDGGCEQLGVDELSKLHVLGHRNDVMSTLSELHSHSAVVVLVEHESQRRAACSRRQAA